MGATISERNRWSTRIFLWRSKNLPCTVNIERYIPKIQNFFAAVLKRFSGFNQGTWFQQDRVSCHTFPPCVLQFAKLYTGCGISNNFFKKNIGPSFDSIMWRDWQASNNQCALGYLQRFLIRFVWRLTFTHSIFIKFKKANLHYSGIAFPSDWRLNI